MVRLYSWRSGFGVFEGFSSMTSTPSTHHVFPVSLVDGLSTARDECWGTPSSDPMTGVMRREKFSRCRRRRPAPVLSAAIVALMVKTSAEPTPTSNAQAHVVPIDSAVLRSNMRYWTTDYAVMFHVPWCVHCKHIFKPVWDLVAAQLALDDPKGKKKMVMATFDCEQDDAAVEFCSEMGLPVYPSFAFFGRGTFHAHDPVSDLVTRSNRAVHPSSVMFPLNTEITDLVFMDWITTMHFVSKSNAVMDKINPFRRRGSQAERTAMEIDALERENQRLREELSQERQLTAKEGEYTYGDPYQELTSTNEGLAADALAWCILEMSNEYCETFGVKWVDPWCSTVEKCVASLGQGVGCFPSKCPLLQEGCNFVSQCLHPQYVQAYQELTTEALAMAEQGHLMEDGALGHDGVAGSQAAATQAQAEAFYDATDASEALPPFLGRAATAGRSGGEKSAEERGETIAA